MSQHSRTIKRFLCIFHILFMGFVIFWFLLCFVPPHSEGAVLSKITLVAIGCFISIVVVAIVIFLFFWKQIVEFIKVGADTIGMYTARGGYIEIKRSEIMYIEERNTRYLILLVNGRIFSVYKGMPPYSALHEKWIMGQVREMSRAYGIPIHYE